MVIPPADHSYRYVVVLYSSLFCRVWFRPKLSKADLISGFMTKAIGVSPYFTPYSATSGFVEIGQANLINSSSAAAIRVMLAITKGDAEVNPTSDDLILKADEMLNQTFAFFLFAVLSAEVLPRC